MIAVRSFALLILVGSVGIVATACGDDGDDGEGGGGDMLGTCDRRDSAFHCIERRGAPAAIEDQEDGCDQAGGSWSNEPCPSEDLVGCCEYTFGDRYRECFYVGTAVDDPEGYCTGMAGFEDAVWTPAN
jgi:hypothetical protein